MSFISEIDDYTIYSLKKDCELGSINLKKGDCVLFNVKRTNYNKIVTLKRFNKNTSSYLYVTLPDDFSYKKYFEVDESATDMFVEDMSEFDDMYNKKENINSFWRTGIAFTVMVMVITVISLLCKTSSYLEEVSGDSFVVFSYLAIIGGVLSIASSIVVLLAYLRFNKLDKLYDDTYNKRLRKLLKKLQ